ncbi:MAG: uroporphyrinogen-III C-methyltransferase [Lachnospirales bacterium]
MVYLLGAGIGNYKYITVKGLELIKKCDVLIYDRLIDNRLLSFAKKDCKLIYVGKGRNNHSMVQEDINKLIVEEGKENNIVVRLKGGDPFVFGRGGEEAEELIKNNIPFQIVPGITSAIAVPELCGIPVTHRGISQDFHIVTGHTAKENIINYEALAKLKGSIVFLMGVKNSDIISSNLIKYGKNPNTPTAIIENGGTENERVFKTTLLNLKDAISNNNIVPPSIILVGETANYNLSNHIKSVGIIGTEDFKKRLEERLYNYKVYDLGTLKIKKHKFDFDLDYDYIVLTSRNGVKIFMDYIYDKKIDIRKLYNIKFAVIGQGTYNYLAGYGIYADIMPSKFTALDLSKALSNCKGKKLILRAEKGSDDLYKYIDNYRDIKTYDIEGENLRQYNTDYTIFASSSAVDFYCSKFEVYGKVIAIGEITARKLKEYGINPYVANEYSIDGIINKLEEI